MDALGPAPDIPILPRTLPPILNVQMDNAVSDNKNRLFSAFGLYLLPNASSGRFM